MTATQIEQEVFAITSAFDTDLLDDFAAFMRAGDGISAVADAADFESYLDTMTDAMFDEIEEVMGRTGSDYSYYSQALGEFQLVNGYISAETWTAIQSNIAAVFIAFQEQYSEYFSLELRERELLSIQHTVNSICDDTSENSESHAAVLEEALIEKFGISSITVTFESNTNQHRTMLVFADLDDDEDADLYETEYDAEARVNAEISDADAAIGGDY